MDGDDVRLSLTSRNPDGSVARFQLLASSPEICRAWVNDVVQILETQRNFLNGKSQFGSKSRRHNTSIYKSSLNVARLPFIGFFVSSHGLFTVESVQRY